MTPPPRSGLSSSASEQAAGERRVHHAERARPIELHQLLEDDQIDAVDEDVAARRDARAPTSTSPTPARSTPARRRASSPTRGAPRRRWVRSRRNPRARDRRHDGLGRRAARSASGRTASTFTAPPTTRFAGRRAASGRRARPRGARSGSTRRALFSQSRSSGCGAIGIDVDPLEPFGAGESKRFQRACRPRRDARRDGPRTCMRCVTGSASRRAAAR